MSIKWISFEDCFIWVFAKEQGEVEYLLQRMFPTCGIGNFVRRFQILFFFKEYFSTNIFQRIFLLERIFCTCGIGSLVRRCRYTMNTVSTPYSKSSTFARSHLCYNHILVCINKPLHFPITVINISANSSWVNELMSDCKIWIWIQ